ncbi:MAG: holo-ACP synthase [Candidatus Omnitrophica bacterium]|nr:holo-ACP synthase [Candidatus Omnitrophota bacterium]
MKIIGTGVDITEVTRLRRAIEKWGDSFLKRIFTTEEIEFAKTKHVPYQHLAGRFAAKEAIFKALGNPKLSFKEVQIFNDEEGKPYCLVQNNKAKNYTIYISISHVKNYAVASAIVTQEKKLP